LLFNRSLVSSLAPSLPRPHQCSTGARGGGHGTASGPGTCPKMDPEELEWLYVDRSGAEFGPFPTGKMRAWFAHGFFPIGKDLLVRMTHWPATTRVPVRDLYPDPEPLADVVVPPALRPRNLGTSL
ncbi:unnamed protein product, partial [Prorocentrum cordatum]